MDVVEVRLWASRRYFFTFRFSAQYAFIRFDTAFLAAADILERVGSAVTTFLAQCAFNFLERTFLVAADTLRRRLRLAVVGFFPPMMLATRCKASMSACSLVILASLALIAWES